MTLDWGRQPSLVVCVFVRASAVAFCFDRYRGMLDLNDVGLDMHCSLLRQPNIE